MVGKYILNGHVPIPSDNLTEWALMFESTNRVVKRDQIDGDVKVSTVFLGIDYQFGDGPPLLFETMIFGGPHDEYQKRYATWDEAEAGHARAVALAKGGK